MSDGSNSEHKSFQIVKFTAPLLSAIFTVQTSWPSFVLVDLPTRIERCNGKLTDAPKALNWLKYELMDSETSSLSPNYTGCWLDEITYWLLVQWTGDAGCAWQAWDQLLGYTAAPTCPSGASSASLITFAFVPGVSARHIKLLHYLHTIVAYLQVNR